MKRFFFIGAILIAVQLIVCQTSDAQSFSVEAGSVDTVGGFPPPDDILLPGPAPVLFGGTGLEVNGFSYGRSFSPFLTTFVDFSVDAASTGTAGAVLAESGTGAGEQNYDVYRSGFMGTNILKHDGNGVGPAGFAAPLGMFEPQIAALPVPPFGTGVDGYDDRAMPGPSIYWTWNSTTTPPFGGPSPSGADILMSPTVPGYVPAGAVYATAGALGLGAGDNIDALEVFDIGSMPGIFDPGDIILFSLDPSSPGLVGSYGGALPADILFADGLGPLGVFASAGSLGLSASDNLTALSVPEATSAMSFLVAIGLVTSRRRRRR